MRPGSRSRERLPSSHALAVNARALQCGPAPGAGRGRRGAPLHYRSAPRFNAARLQEPGEASGAAAPALAALIGFNAARLQEPGEARRSRRRRPRAPSASMRPGSRSRERRRRCRVAPPPRRAASMRPGSRSRERLATMYPVRALEAVLQCGPAPGAGRGHVGARLTLLRAGSLQCGPAPGAGRGHPRLAGGHAEGAGFNAARLQEPGEAPLARSPCGWRSCFNAARLQEPGEARSAGEAGRGQRAASMRPGSRSRERRWSASPTGGAPTSASMRPGSRSRERRGDRMPFPNGATKLQCGPAPGAGRGGRRWARGP